MEVVNVTPEKFLQIIARVGYVLGCLMLLYKSPDILMVLVELAKVLKA